jgi:hypothetical protein
MDAKQMVYRPISTAERLPKMWVTYFIIIDGRKDIVTLPWINKRVERYPESPFIWLEQVPEQVIHKKKVYCQCNPSQLCLFDFEKVQKAGPSKPRSSQSQSVFSSPKPWESSS